MTKEIWILLGEFEFDWVNLRWLRNFTLTECHCITMGCDPTQFKRTLYSQIWLSKWLCLQCRIEYSTPDQPLITESGLEIQIKNKRFEFEIYSNPVFITLTSQITESVKRRNIDRKCWNCPPACLNSHSLEHRFFEASTDGKRTSEIIVQSRIQRIPVMLFA